MRAVNLLPSEPKRSHGRPTLVTQLAIVSPLVVAGVLAAGYLLASSDVNSNKATLSALQDELSSLPKPTPARQANPALAAEQGMRVAALGAALQSRLVWDRVLREVSAVLPSDVWLTQLSAQTPQAPVPVGAAVAPPTDTTATSSSTTTSGTTTAAPAPAPAVVAQPLTLQGYTYSQEGVARLLGRLSVVPALQDVKLLQSSQSDVADQKVISFSIQATVRPGETG